MTKEQAKTLRKVLGSQTVTIRVDEFNTRVQPLLKYLDGRATGVLDKDVKIEDEIRTFLESAHKSAKLITDAVEALEKQTATD